MSDENISVYDNFDENVDQKDTLTDNYVDDNVGQRWPSDYFFHSHIIGQ